jgi:glycosyltransferase involved in cell wall biosynthesis
VATPARLEPRLCYIAYPLSLTLQSANAIQTFATLRALQRLRPTLALVPRWLAEPSRFLELGALHLPRPAVGKLARLYRTTLWSYAERSIFAAMTAAAVAWRRLRGRRADAVFVRDVVCAAWWGTLWGRLLRLPVIYEAHDLESENPSRAREGWAQPWLRRLDRAALRRSAAVVSLTEDFRRQLEREGWRPAPEVTVIPDAFDEERFVPADRAAVRARLGLDARQPLFVYAGLTFVNRGLERLLDAFAGVRQAVPDARLALVGRAEEEAAELRARARALALDGTLLWPGRLPQEHVVPFLHAADVLVMPDTVREVSGSPLKLFEYMAVGRAIVLPDIPALAEVLPRSVGYYFPRGNTQALASALLRALQDPERPRREQAAREAVLPFTFSARAGRIVAVVEQALGERRRDLRGAAC